MSARRRWTRRVLTGVAAFAVLDVVLAATGNRPDHVRVALLVALVTCVLGLLVDAAPLEPASWAQRVERPEGPGSRDPRTAAHLRLLEDHRTSRTPNPVLRRRLRELTDQVLATRHDLDRADPAAQALLGPELMGVLVGPVRRLDPDQIERCVRRIEEL